MTTNYLEIKDLRAKVKSKEILRGVNLIVKPGQVVALMGPNGSGKSSLAKVIMGNPFYRVTSGEIIFRGKDILKLKPWQRARLGLFLAFQNPVDIPGVNIYQLLQTASQNQLTKKFNLAEFEKSVLRSKKDLKLADKFLDRDLAGGFSGGEKKRLEILQLKIFKPKLAILDEIDSGLDIDALKLVAANIKKLISPKFSALVITHYQRLLNYLRPDEVKIMVKGRIVESGQAELVKKVEKIGYQQFL